MPPVISGRKVSIDPGYSISDPEAIGNGMHEKDVIFEISKKVGNILILKELTVEYSRKSDVGVTLSGRAEMANSWGASLFVFIYSNSFRICRLMEQSASLSEQRIHKIYSYL